MTKNFWWHFEKIDKQLWWLVEMKIWLILFRLGDIKSLQPRVNIVDIRSEPERFVVCYFNHSMLCRTRHASAHLRKKWRNILWLYWLFRDIRLDLVYSIKRPIFAFDLIPCPCCCDSICIVLQAFHNFTFRIIRGWFEKNVLNIEDFHIISNSTLERS